MSERWFPTVTDLEATGTSQQELHMRAAELSRRRFGRRVFMRGVVEVSNYCRENCAYCGMRRDNRTLERSRADLDRLTEWLLNHRPDSITDLNIQAGEDPRVVEQVVLPLLQVLKRETSLGLTVSLGTLDRSLTDALREAGATTYIIKFEMADRDLYRKLQAPGTLEERLQHIHRLAQSGWRVSSGFIAGLPGQTSLGLLQNFQLAARLPLVGCSVSPFVPGNETPLAGSASGSLGQTLNCMAALRCLRPDWIIPAVSALNLAGSEDGYVRGLRVGANLCTMNLTPADYRHDYLIYTRARRIMTEERILAALAGAGMEPSSERLIDYFSGVPEAETVGVGAGEGALAP